MGIASTLIGLFVLATLGFHALGMFKRSTAHVLLGLIAFFMLAFFVAFRQGLHWWFREKRLKLPIVATVMACMLLVVYLDPALQILLVPFSFVAMAYGMYRISRGKAFALAFAVLAGYALVIDLHSHNRRTRRSCGWRSGTSWRWPFPCRPLPS